MQKNTHYFKVLDSWRGICACMVALVHFGCYNHVFQYPIFWNAGYYVDFFFVLSGFVIFANYQKALSEGFSPLRFMIYRFGRLYPLHALTLTAFIVHELLQMALPGIGSYSTFKPFASPGETPADILVNFLLLHSFDLVGRYSLNSPSWSISAEFYTYILFAVLLFKTPKKILYWITLFLALGFLFFLFFDGKGATHNWGIFRCIYGFSAGGLCWILWNKHHERTRNFINRKAAWNALEILTIALAFYLINAAGKTFLIYVTPFVFVALIYVFAFELGSISRLLNKKPFLLLGTLSYSIYMWHAFISWKVINPVFDVLQKVIGTPMTTMIDGKRKIGLEMWQGDIASLSYLAIVVIWSYLSYRFFEAPCRDAIKNLAKRISAKKSLPAAE